MVLVYLVAEGATCIVTKMDHKHNKRRNSIERYQPKSKHNPDEDIVDSFNQVSLEDRNTGEEGLRCEAPVYHHKKKSPSRRGVNSHLFGRSNDGRRGRGRGSHRGSKYGEQHSSSSLKNYDDRNSWGQNNPENFNFVSNSNEQKPYYQPSYRKHVQEERGMTPRKKNTETFKPSHKPAEMRILAAHAGWKKYSREITSRDVLVVHDLFCEPNDLTIYNKLLGEIRQSGIEETDLWQLWHGDSHVIADDKKKWKESCPTFHMVLNKISDYFDMDIKATRLNWYRDSKEWKPFHHDAAAIKPDKAKTQNFTVAVSFGAEREAAFEHATTKTVISMPQPNGTIYVFSKDVNVIWRHGILQVPPEKYHSEGRISIIAWGWVEQNQV
ncbi:uncharacterized protein LOC130629501 [Hydractinia symbiolongicarpus]|uniref:uncharacterized protein LOC130629501 n=1 Tax=Hydractinia symbiolongicarpus TaxID=13093 RepID=UPI00254BC5F8|nr:uncharacterized protein LOC130629501 [Hydractinia symbiolongicarpus]